MRAGSGVRLRIAAFAFALAIAMPAAAAPKDIVLMLDNSGSMIKNDPEHLTTVAVRTFLNSLGTDTRVSIVIFDQIVRVAMPLTELDDATRPRFLASLDTIDFKGQLTNSPAALERSIYELRTKGRADADRSIVFLTDGIVDTGDKARDRDKIRWMRNDLAADAAAAGIRIFGIAFTDNADFELMQSLARSTGGEYFRAYAASDVQPVFDRIVARLEHGAGAPAAATGAAPPPQPTAPLAAPAAEAAPSESMSSESSASAEPIEPPAAPEPRETSGSSNAAAPAGSAAPSAGELPSVGGLPVASALPEAGNSPETGTLPDAGALPDAGTLPESTGAPEATQPAGALPDAGTEGAGAAPESQAAAGEGAAPAGTSGTQGETNVAEPAAEPATGSGASPASPAPTAPPSAAAGIDRTLLLAAGAASLVVLLALGAYVVRRRRSRRADPTPSEVPRAFLNDLGGASANASYELTDQVTVIGRLAGAPAANTAYIVIDEPTIGRRHAIIEYREHAYWVADQNSLNGTYVNDRRTEGSTRLKHGDRLKFHRHEFEFLMLDMFETDRTMVSETMFANISAAADAEEQDEDATVQRARADTTERPGGPDPG